VNQSAQRAIVAVRVEALESLPMNHSLVVSNGEIGDCTGEKRLAEMESFGSTKMGIPLSRIEIEYRQGDTLAQEDFIRFTLLEVQVRPTRATRSVSLSCHRVFRNYRESWWWYLSKCGYMWKPHDSYSV
jgi:hypothetical protein